MRWRAPWLFGLLLAACGSRTALLAGTVLEDGDNGPTPTEDGGVRARDGGGLDGTIGPSDAGAKDASEDVRLPPIDTSFRPDSAVNACPNAESTLIYLMTNAGNLVSYFPVTNAFQTIGKISCPLVGDSRPFSMAVDRKGVAFVVFDDGHLYRVSTKTATCIETGFVLRQSGFLTFGMGFVLDDAMGDSLYVIGRPDIDGAKGHLATIDRGLNLRDLGEVQPDVSGAELTGTGDGRLFAFYKIPGRVGTAVGEIDRMTATLVAQSPLPEVEQGDGWAFAFWGGAFYTFTAPNGTSQVTRFNPANGKVEKVADFTGGGVIVGAGVSTCAPAQ